MSGPIGLGDLRIILRALVDILNHQADRRAGGPALEHSRKDADPVRLLPLRGVARLPRPPLVQPALTLRLRQAEVPLAPAPPPAHRAAVAHLARAPSRHTRP